MKTERLEALAREIASREAGRGPSRARARRLAERLRVEVERAVARFVRAAAEAGAPHLDLIRVGSIDPDDKSVRAFQLRVTRGRHVAIVVCKDRGEVMLVGPFRQGDAEGPCDPIHLEQADSAAQLEDRLEAMLVRLIQVSFQK